MLITLPDVLNPDELAQAQALLARSAWAGGEITAGLQAAQVKNNRQLAESAEHLPALRRLVLGALSRNAGFFTAALPRRIYPPLFNSYTGATNCFGNHVDGAVRPIPDGGGHLRTDVSATLFLSDPADYDGGELVIEDTFGDHSIKLAAGSMVVYPSSSIHRVEPVTRGERQACFLWLESMVRDAGQRRLLYEMDMALLALRRDIGDTAPVVRLTGTYHNLLRQWAEA
ncbi:MAG TPA: Fe2+-dependent dioxygenase [Zoogloea sp.]|jgi:PKHD-type hydroxylase|uniref:Fe2+-dependent dioxygenase n=1 Tax=Zoogloea sp. TaxID=49181 RepID=UPI001B73A9B4|nr:Fe2+-dependent dioxygenase [Zoogloea sp.]MBP8267048.1 Fe2+-dependent dioxygenase [Zoogloea sp.]HOB45164.1 Fe2+-dependent dioxygenase [Zoogloea sp.]HQA11049.1 Fe2+-dependent dioxygenase [Zoogloea sp.]HQE37719.1 Fe2+-dependent dioxygenase [Zoogloea sp.]